MMAQIVKRRKTANIAREKQAREIDKLPNRKIHAWILSVLRWMLKKR